MSSVDSSQDPQWIVQILFGRYRSWGAITVGHLILMAAIGVSLAYAYLILLKLRFNSYTRQLENIPRNFLPVRKKELERTLYAILINELVRVDAILEKKIEPENNFHSRNNNNMNNNNNNNNNNFSSSSLKNENFLIPNEIFSSNDENEKIIGDPGWGAEESKVENVHFNTSIAKSYYVLEKTILARRPGLRHRDSRSIRDYIALMKKSFPNLRSDLVDSYIKIYEIAVFGNHKFNYYEYSQFMKILYEMVAIINEKPLFIEEMEKSNDNEN